MSLIGDDIGAQDTDVDEDAPSPWESIELEEADREPDASAWIVHSQQQSGASFATSAGSLFSRDAQRSASGQPGQPNQDGTPRIAVEPNPLRVAVKPLAAPPLSAGAAPRFDRDSQGNGFDPQPADSEEALDRPSRGGGWTIPLLCVGIGLIACCLIIPQADSNRRMAYQKVLLQRDLESIQKQVTVNDEFLKRVNDDSGLAERLAQRQMNIVREGNRVWIDGQSSATLPVMSPYELTTVPKPAPLPPYQPTGGWFAALCRDPRSNLYLTGSALMMLAAGLVMGMAPRTE